MIDQTTLDEIRRLAEAAPIDDLPVIWLENAEAADPAEGRCWCEDELDDKPTKYVRSDLAPIDPATAIVILDALEEARRERDTLRAEIERVREALEPFAVGARLADGKYAYETGGQDPMRTDHAVEILVVGEWQKVGTLGDLRRARTAYEGKGDDHGQD